jgi:tetratricopeptide (TPR) repeat protein
MMMTYNARDCILFARKGRVGLLTVLGDACAFPAPPSANRGDTEEAFMIRRYLCLGILAASISWSAAAMAHGPMERAAGPAAPPAATAPADVIPANLLAAVCGMHGAHDQTSFQRRVELARVLLARSDAAAKAPEAPPLFEDLGGYSYPITTASAEAHRYFDQGLRLTYAFNHPEALRAFRAAQRLDPGCALCFWGEAYALGPNINASMDGEALAPAMAAVERAMALRAGAGERERALIEALSRRYSLDPVADRPALNAAYAEAMAEVARRFPADPDILSLYGDALMNLSPWDYWEKDARTLKPAQAELVATLEKALAADPRHPYAIHLYIHAVEASTAPERAEPYADRLAQLMPGAGHMVHMPAHIYFRVGRFADSIAANKDAVTADEAYVARAAPDSLYPYSYYPHNVHFLLESARMAGDGATALAAAEKLPGVLSDDVAAQVPWVQLIKAAPYFAHAQFSEPRVTLALPDPGDRFAYVRAMWHYARGVANAAAGEAGAAQAEADAIARIAAEGDFKPLVEGGLPAVDLLRLARLIVVGRIAQARADAGEAVAAFEEAAAIDRALPYLEPPFWYYPVDQSLGAALLQSGRVEEAEAAFRAALARYPGNAWALYGLREVARHKGDAFAAAEADRLLKEKWLGPKDDGLSLSRL